MNMFQLIIGVKIFIISLGSGASLSELQTITKRPRIFMARNYKSIVMGGRGLRIGGRRRRRGSIFLIFQRRFSRCKLKHICHCCCQCLYQMFIPNEETAFVKVK